MGTKLEYAINVPLAPNSSNFGQQFVDVLNYLHTRVLSKDLQVSGLDKFKEKKMPNNHNIDAIKRTMQMHEDIFKHQVRELHRLYEVQKMLMDELKREIKQSDRKHWNPTTTSPDTNRKTPFTNRHNSRSALPTTSGCAYNGQLSRDEHSSGERSGSCSNDTMKMARIFDLERLPAAEEDTAVCASDTDDNHHYEAGPSSSLCIMPQKSNNNIVFEREDEVELTLSIGGGATNKKMYKDYHALDHHFQPMHNKDTKDLLDDHSPPDDDHSPKDCCSGPAATSMSSSSATFDQKRKGGPHWLFQGLSINRT